MRKKRYSASTRRGFTLVELLVVIVIIAILAAFLVVGVMAAMQRAQEARIRAEIMGLVGALEQYKLLYDAYPPSDSAKLENHLDRIFPRRESETIPTDMTEAQMLYFCLAGYSPNPKLPLTGEGARPLFDFDKSRLSEVHTERKNMYFPPGGFSRVPYIYFHKVYDTTTKTYEWSDSQSFQGSSNDDENIGQVKVKVDVGKDFQIVCAGLEENFDVNRPETNITSYQDGTEED